jgi:hypothetical protein
MRDHSQTGHGVVDALLDRWIGPAVDWIVGGLVGALVLLGMRLGRRWADDRDGGDPAR